MIVAGGHGYNEKDIDTIEVLTSDLQTRNKLQLPNLPTKEMKCHSMFIHNGNIMVCVGFGKDKIMKRCLKLENGIWKSHSFFKRRRDGASIVSTDFGIFVFGGCFSSSSYEYFPNGSKKWKMGKSKIPNGGIAQGCAIEIKSKQQILLIGGARSESRILSFDMNTHQFNPWLTTLTYGRFRHACAFVPGSDSKILVTGGICRTYMSKINFVEMIDVSTQSVTMASPMVLRRYFHEHGVMNINGEDKLVALGGYHTLGENQIPNIEIFDAKNQKWELSTYIKMTETSRFKFGCVTVAPF